MGPLVEVTPWNDLLHCRYPCLSYQVEPSVNVVRPSRGSILFTYYPLFTSFCCPIFDEVNFLTRRVVKGEEPTFVGTTLQKCAGPGRQISTIIRILAARGTLCGTLCITCASVIYWHRHTLIHVCLFWWQAILVERRSSFTRLCFDACVC